MTPRRRNTVGHVHTPATTGQAAGLVATCINMATNMAASTADSAAEMAGNMATDTAAATDREPASAAPAAAVVAAEGTPAAGTGDAVITPARGLSCRLFAGMVSRVVAVVGLLVGLSWCLPAPAAGAAAAIAALVPAVVSAVFGAWRPAQTLGAVVIAAPGELPGSGITIEAFAQNVQWFIVGILGTLTITYFMIGFARLIAARGQSEEYTKARESLKSSLYGFLGVMLTPAIVSALQGLFASRGR